MSGRRAAEVWSLVSLSRVGWAGPRDVVAWAAQRVAEDDAGASVLALACLAPDVDRSDIAPLLDGLLAESGLPQMSDREARLWAAAAVAQQVLAGGEPVVEGSRRIAQLREDATTPELDALWIAVDDWEDEPEMRPAIIADLKSEMARIAALGVAPVKTRPASSMDIRTGALSAVVSGMRGMTQSDAWERALEHYIDLLRRFVDDEVSADLVEKRYITMFSEDVEWPDQVHRVLEEFFFAVDDYTPDPRLRTRPQDIDGDELRRRAATTLDALVRLRDLKTGE